MSDLVSLSVSKLDAARRQLEVAIRLYFSDDDPISTYTLAAAAYEILKDIALAKSVVLQTGEQTLLERAVPGKERELTAALRRHQNFFKHADRDPDAAIDFNPESSEWRLHDCCIAYGQLTLEVTPLMGTFKIWWRYQHRDLIKAEHSDMREKLERHAQWFSDGRREYFTKVLPIFQGINAASQETPDS